MNNKHINIEPKDTYLLKAKHNTNTVRHTGTAAGHTAHATPAVQAIPFPPLNFK